MAQLERETDFPKGPKVLVHIFRSILSQIDPIFRHVQTTFECQFMSSMVMESDGQPNSYFK